MKITTAKIVWDFDTALSIGVPWTKTQQKNYETSSVWVTEIGLNT